MSPALLHALRSSFFALVLVLAACSRPPPPAAAPVAAPPSTAPVAEAKAKAETVCDLITADELETVFSGTSTATPEHHQTFGIKACEWNGDFGRLLVQQWPSKGHTPQDEVSDLVTGFIDASKPGARASVRMVSPPGLGHYATAVVEPRDLERGVLADIAVLSIARDGQTLVFLTNGLEGMERQAALAKLVQLGRFAYPRL
ncbi:hypothetical protein [Pseudoxanthomonas sp. UC19_8]|uniref:hypothetical protein n=1 Tax=Pseudoxanthomonas sp. UC19_8 TaxID=3350175 RepID=UPI0036D43E6C